MWFAIGLVVKPSKLSLICFPLWILHLSFGVGGWGWAGLLIVSSGLRANLGCFLAAYKESSFRSIMTFAKLQKSMLTPKVSGNMFCCHLDVLKKMVLGKPPGSLSCMLLHHLTCVQTASRTQARTSEPQLTCTKSLFNLVGTGDVGEMCSPLRHPTLLN